jgi:hypothetical protein
MFCIDSGLKRFSSVFSDRTKIPGLSCERSMAQQPPSAVVEEDEEDEEMHRLGIQPNPNVLFGW